MKLFFVEEVTSTVIRLGVEESYHLIQVLRMQAGDEVYLTDGLGNIWRAVIRLASKRGMELYPLEHRKAYGKRPYRVHMGITPTKSSERFEWFLEKAVEIGVDEITPLFCQCSERKKLNMDRVMKIIRSAVKQSFRAYLPVLNDPLSYRDFVLSRVEFGCKLIAHCNEDFERKPLKVCIEVESELYTILIGPEGDFSPEEIEEASVLGWQGVRLGQARLRTETAALIALQTVALHFEDEIEDLEKF
ncbi:MAG: RsmE family RNA methyltransferase [Flavobacteriales bacterium Tduv]